MSRQKKSAARNHQVTGPKGRNGLTFASLTWKVKGVLYTILTAVLRAMMGVGDGVYLVASGGGSGGQFEVVTAGDTNNTKIAVVYPGDTAAATNLYDTYARVVVEA